MSDWFSRAAISRIAECAVSEATSPAKSSAASLMDRYLQSDKRFSGDDFHKLRRKNIFGEMPGPNEADELHAFGGLLELAVQAGYVDLKYWPEVRLLRKALKDFMHRESKPSDGKKPTDLVLIQSLIARIDRDECSVRRRDDAAFYAFPSYLHLTASIRDDHEVRGFLNNCTNSWSREDDLAFLITPQHFAEALVHGTVAGMESPTVRSGISVLRYLEGFSEILDRVKHDEALAYSFLRQARWSRHIPVVINRLELWADRMAEWDPFGENSWEKFQARLWTLQGYVREFHGWSLVGQKVVTPQSIESLLQEGRTGAAIRLARDEALHRRSRIGTARTEEYAATAAAETVEACEKLAEIGGLDAAAVILAPIISKLAGSLRGRAQAILAQVRNRSSVDQPATQLYMENVPVPAHSKPATMEMKKTSGGHEAV